MSRAGDGHPTDDGHPDDGHRTDDAGWFGAGYQPAPSLAWFHCFAGIAGDMALGSLLDAGADLSEVVTLLERLPVAGWSLDVHPVLRGGIAASQAIVTVQDTVVVRTHAHIVGLIEEARLPERVAHRSLAIFAALAGVEANLHRRRVDQVHFHEVGGHDTIVDVVGTAAALEVLGIDEVRASPVATGLGMVRSGHGLLPNPAPAVVALLEGVPTWGRNVPVELTTPTGAAIVAALSSGYGPMPPMRVTAQGFGAGSRTLDELPNCTQVVTGVSVDRRSGTESTFEPAPAGGPDPDSDAGQPVALLEANVDDATGEQLAHAIEALLQAGAHDAWLSPVIMKKGRPGSVVHVLADQAAVADLRAVIRETTGSLGVRMTSAERWPAARTLDSVWVGGQLIRIKVSTARIKAEHEDVAAAARRTGQSLREVAFRAEAMWRAEHGRSTGHDQPSEPSQQMPAPLHGLEDAGAGHPSGTAPPRRWGAGGRGGESDGRREPEADDPA
jgi:pyridinium-3,5-bisthiocarboxylic acid mononucleotide nickel chelatase